MASVLFAGEEPPQLSRGLSGIFRRKSKGNSGGSGSHSVFEAEPDSLDAHFAAATTTAPSGGAAASTTSAAAAAAQLEPPARTGSKSGRWGLLSRKHSLSRSDSSAAPAAAAVGATTAHPAHAPAAAAGVGAPAAAQQQELLFFRAECLRQGQELGELQEQLQAAQAAAQQAQHEAQRAQEASNMQRFKFELLVDLWAMRVLDNEELGSQVEEQAAAGAAAAGGH